MAPSLLSVCTAALALAGDVAATKFYLEDTYNHLNFFDKFNFFESRYGTGDYNDVDPTSGYINYRSRKDAEALGLIRTVDNEVYMGVDHTRRTTFPGVGRDSVRIESKEIYNKGLFIARFSHLPKPTCGVWPAFWSYGDPWPKVGELDWYEGWNEQAVNHPAVHTGHAAENGTCHISPLGQTSTVTHANCDNFGGIWENQGCTSAATPADPWGSSSGGVYAIEWTDDYIKFFAWHHALAPPDINSDSPDTRTWGKPSVLVPNHLCDIDSHFANQKLVLNINFCGVAAIPSIWGDHCAARTRQVDCGRWVANNPAAFKDVYWQIKDIRFFTEKVPVVSSSAIPSASSSAVPSSSDVPVSSSVVSSSAVSSAYSSAAVSSSYGGNGNSSSSAIPSQTSSGIPASITSSSSADASLSSYISQPPRPSSSYHFTNSSSSGYHQPSSSFHFTNSSTPAPSTTQPPQFTTSTVYTTSTYTITSCSADAPDCPGKIGQVVTKTIPIYTTVCPISVTTKTLKRIHEITACPPEVRPTDCPYGSLTTETITTTITHVIETKPTPPGKPGYGGHDEDDDDDGKDVGVGIKDDDGDDDGDDDDDKDPEYKPIEDEAEPSAVTTEYITATVIPVPIHTPSGPASKGYNVTYPPPHDDDDDEDKHDEKVDKKLPIEDDDFEFSGAVQKKAGTAGLSMTLVLVVAVALFL